jgi:hypothetical protein
LADFGGFEETLDGLGRVGFRRFLDDGSRFLFFFLFFAPRAIGARSSALSDFVALRVSRYGVTAPDAGAGGVVVAGELLPAACFAVAGDTGSLPPHPPSPRTAAAATSATSGRRGVIASVNVSIRC